MSNTGEDVEQLELPYIAAENVKWCMGKECSGFLYN